MDRPSTRSRQRASRALLGAVLAALNLTACSPGDSEPQRVVAEPTPTEAQDGPGELGEMRIAPAEVWGRGRALRTMPRSDGGLVVATTTGVYVAPAEADPVAIATFESPWQIGPLAISPDESTLALAIKSPPSVRVFDLPARSLVASHDLPSNTELRSVSFNEPSGGFRIDTSAGPLFVPDASTSAQALIEPRLTGRTAELADGTLVTPIIGTNELSINRQGATEPKLAVIPAGSTLLDARSSPAGSTLGVSITAPEALDGGNRIAILDAATFELRTVIDVGRVFDTLQWTVTEDAAVVADGPALEVHTFDGTVTAAPGLVSSQIVRLLPIDNGLLSVHSDGAVVRWASETWSATVIDPGGIALEDVAVDPTSTTLTTVDYFGLITTWSIGDGVRLAADDRFAIGEATDVAIAGDGNRVSASWSSGRVAILDPSLTEQWAFQQGAESALVGSVSFDPANGELVTGLAERVGDKAFDDAVTVWDPVQREARYTIGGESEDVAGCAFYYSRVRFDPDGRLMAVSSHDFSLLVVEVATGAVIQELTGPTTILDLAFSPDGTLLAATYDNAAVSVWNTSDFSMAASYGGTPGGYFAIEMMPDGTSMAAVDITGAISLVDVLTGAALGTLSDATFRTSTLALSRDGALVAAPAADGAIAIWSTSTRSRVATLTGHTAPVTGLAFAPSGTWIASSSSDGTVRTWTVTDA